MMMSQSSGRRGVAWAIVGGLVLLAGIVAIIVSAVLARPTPTPSATSRGTASADPTTSAEPDPDADGAVVDPTATDRVRRLMFLEKLLFDIDDAIAVLED